MLNYLKLNWGIILPTVISFVSVCIFYDTAWLPFDFGIHSHFADKLNRGLVYGVDIFDIHAGYQVFLDAWLFQIFGRDMVVLLYPFFLITPLQTALVANLFREKGQLASFSIGIVNLCFTFILFANPSPNWYALFFAVCVSYFLTKYPANIYRESAVGVALGLCLMFRYPSAIFLGFGVVLFYIYESSKKSEGKIIHFTFTGFIQIVIFVCLSFYLYLIFELSVVLILGILPLIFLLLGYLNFISNDKEVFLKILQIIFFAFLAILPMIIYQILVGDFNVWFHQSFIASSEILNHSSILKFNYLENFHFKEEYPNDKDIFYTFIVVVRYITWLMMLFIPAYINLLACKRIKNNIKIPPIVFIAIFYTFISIYYQYYVYFLFSFILNIIALFSLVKVKKIYYVSLIVISIYCFLLFSHSSALNTEHRIESSIVGVSFEIPETSNYAYNSLISLINKYSAKEDSMFVYPQHSELYFLTGRINIFPFANVHLYMFDEESYLEIIAKIDDELVPLIIFDSCAYDESDYDAIFKNWLNENRSYDLVEEHECWTFYKRS